MKVFDSFIAAFPQILCQLSVSVSSVCQVAHNWKSLEALPGSFDDFAMFSPVFTACCGSVKSQTDALLAQFLIPLLNH